MREYPIHWIRNVISKERKIKESFKTWLGSEDRYSKEELIEMEKIWNESKKNLNLNEAILSLKKFKRKDNDMFSQYFLAGTGPFKDVLQCDYFSLDFSKDSSEGTLSTSIDLYAQDILATDYEVVDE